jgi:quercetin dioxygenase-like cupin family protein
MNTGNIFKVWGTRNRILLTDSCEIDYLKLKKNTFCSLHYHSKKINLFYVLKGKVRIETEFGKITLRKNQSFIVTPSLKHRFVVLIDSEMIECAYVNKGKLNIDDIYRQSEGGQIIQGKYFDINELRKKGYLEISHE